MDFYIKANSVLTQDIINELKKEFENKVNFVEVEDNDGLEIKYQASNNKFYFGNFNYGLDNLELRENNGKLELFHKNKTTSGFKLIEYNRDQMFGIEDHKTKELFTQMADFCKKKFNIDFAPCVVQTNNREKNNVLYFTMSAVNKKIIFEDSYKINKTLNNFLSQQENISLDIQTLSKNLKKILDFEQEMIVKKSVIALISKGSFLSNVLKEQKEFIDKEPVGTYKNHYVFDNYPKDSSFSQIGLWASQINFYYERFEEFLISGNLNILKSDGLAHKNHNEIYAIFDFFQTYPQSSKSLNEVFNVIRDYDKSTIENIIKNNDNINFLQSTLKTKNYFLLPQGIQSSSEECYDSIKDVKNAFQNISISTLNDSGGNNKNIGGVTIETAKTPQNNDILKRESFFMFSGSNNKTFIDTTIYGDSVSEEVISAFVKSQNDGYLIVKNEAEFLNQSFPKIKLDDNTIAYVLNKSSKSDSPILFENIDDILKNKMATSEILEVVSQTKQGNNSTYKAFFYNSLQTIMSNNQKKKFIVSSPKKPLFNTINKYAIKNAESQILPIHAYTSPLNKEPYIRNPRANSYTEYDNIIEKIYVDEVYNPRKSKYNLSNPLSNEVEPNSAFIEDSSARLLGVPLSYDLSTQENRDIFFKIALNAIKDYAIKANLNQDKIRKMITQTANIVYNQKTDNAIVTLNSVIDFVPDVNPKNIPLEYLTAGSKDKDIIGFFPFPYNFFVEEAKKQNAILLTKERLKVPPITPEVAEKIIKQNKDIWETILPIIEEVTRVNQNDIKALCEKILSSATIDDIDLKAPSDDFKKLRDVAQKYYSNFNYYPSLDDIITSFSNDKELKKSVKTLIEIQGCIKNIYNFCAIDDKKDEFNKNVEDITLLFQQVYIKDKKVDKKLEELNNKILRAIQIRDGKVDNTIDRLTLSFLHYQVISDLDKEYEKFIDLFNKQKIAVKMGDKEKITSAKQEAKDFGEELIKKAKDEFFKKYSITNQDETENNLNNANSLRAYQAQATINFFNDNISKADKLENINIIYPPRGGKTRTGTLVGIMETDFKRDDKIFFYAQKKNMDDIINQIMDSFPELCGVLKIQNYDNPNGFFNNQICVPFVDREPICSIPQYLSNYLNETYAKTNNSIKYELLDHYGIAINSILSAGYQLSQKEIESKIKEKIDKTENPFYELYFKFKEIATKIEKERITLLSANEPKIFNANVAMAMTYYIAQLHNNDLIIKDDKEAIFNNMLSWYEKACLSKTNSKDTKIVIASKNDLTKDLPTKEVILNLVADKDNTIRLQNEIDKKFFNNLKFSGGIYNIDVNNVKIDAQRISFDVSTSKQTEEIIKEAVNNIDFADNSSLLELGKKNEIAIILDERKMTGKKPLSQKEVLQIQLYDRQFENEKTSFVNNVLNFYSEKMVEAISNIGLDKRDIEILKNNIIDFNICSSYSLPQENKHPFLQLIEHSQELQEFFLKMPISTLEKHKQEINDIQINSDYNLLCATAKIDEILPEYKIFSQQIDNEAYLEDERKFAEFVVKNAEKYDGFTDPKKQELAIQAIVSAINEANKANFATIHNRAVLRQKYRELCLPRIVTTVKNEKTYRFLTPSDIFNSYDKDNGVSFVKINFKNLGNFFYHRSSIDFKSQTLTFAKFQPFGKKYDLDNNETNQTALSVFDSSLSVSVNNSDAKNKKSNNQPSYIFTITNPNGNYELMENDKKNNNFNSKDNEFNYPYSIISNTLFVVDETRAKNNGVIIDEFHKNMGENTLGKTTYIKAKTSANKIFQISGTPKFKKPNIFSILDIKGIGISFLIALYRKFGEDMNNISKKAVANKLKNPNFVIANGVSEFWNIKGLKPYLVNFMRESYGDIDISSELTSELYISNPKYYDILFNHDFEIYINFINDVTESIIKAVYESVATDLAGKSVITNSAIPNFLYDNKSFYDTYLGEKMTNYKFNISSICIGSQTLEAYFENKNKQQSMDIVRSPKIAYNIENMPQPLISNYNKESAFPKLFKAISVYNSRLKTAKFLKRTDFMIDSFYNSFKDTSSMENGIMVENFNSFEENVVAKENIRRISEKLADYDLSFTDFMLSKNISADISANAITKDMIRNPEKYVDMDINDILSEVDENSELIDKDKKLIIKKVSFIKDCVLPFISELVNNNDYLHSLEYMASSVMKNDSMHYVFDKANTDTPYILMFNKTIFDGDIDKSMDISDTILMKNDGFCVKMEDSTQRVFFNYEVSFDKTMLAAFFEKSKEYFGDFEPFKDRLGNSISSFDAYSILSNDQFDNFLISQNDKNYKYPIFTNRIASNLIVNLKALEYMIKCQENTLNTKNKVIFSLITNPQIQKIFDTLDVKKLKAEHNIDFVIVKNTNDLQKSLDKLRDANTNPDVLILPMKQSAEGVQIYGFTIGDDKNPCRICFADGKEASKDTATLTQAISRVDCMELRKQQLQQNGNDSFCFNLTFFGFNLSSRMSLPSSRREYKNYISVLQAIADDGIVDGKDLIIMHNSNIINELTDFIAKESNNISKIPYSLNAYAQQFTSSLNTTGELAKISTQLLGTLIDKEQSENFPSKLIEEKVQNDSKKTFGFDIYNNIADEDTEVNTIISKLPKP